MNKHIKKEPNAALLNLYFHLFSPNERYAISDEKICTGYSPFNAQVIHVRD